MWKYTNKSKKVFLHLDDYWVETKTFPAVLCKFHFSVAIATDQAPLLVNLSFCVSVCQCSDQVAKILDL